ncbi:MAG: mandelate racemase/muconate lactonizing enzyme family protein [Deltaproteobacteria bacterium]|nr:mandelate racemase/muconate lactonizing enzyme family protein [Deltaproteobacteria bacterium]
MKITAVESLILQADIGEELGYSQMYLSRRTHHLVRVSTDAGLTGTGEVFGGGAVAFGNKGIVEQVLRPMLLGRNPLDIGVLWHEVYNLLRDHGQKGMPIQCLSGVDIALWDILGQATGQPLYQLLGGAVRKEFTAYGYGMMFRKVPDLPGAFEEEAVRIREAGFRAAKMKIGLGLRQDTALATAVRRGAGPDFKLMADANHAYTAGEAIQVGRMLRELGFYWFEEPVMPEDYEGYRQVKAALPGVLIAGGEAEFTRFGHRELISRRCVDILQPEVAGAGGISEFLKIYALASAFGIPVIPHVWGSDVLLAVDMHLVASLPDIPGGLVSFDPMLEYDTTYSPFRDRLLVEPFDIPGQVKHSGGKVRVPEKPGLGVTLNMDVVKKYRVA